MQALGGELGLAGEVVERHGASLLQVGAVAAPQHASPHSSLQCVFFAPPDEKSQASPGGARPRAGPKWPLARGRLEARVGAVFRIVWQAAEKFAADDGWAIASYIGLTLLTSLFPFLIFVAALAGFLRLGRTGEGGGEAGVRRMAGGCGAPDRRRGGAGSDDSPQRRIAHLRRGLLVLFRFERDRSASSRAQSRLRPRREETVVAAAAPVAGAGAGRVDCAAWRWPSLSCSGR